MSAVSQAHISKSEDKAMDEAGPSGPPAPAGVSIRNGPVLGDKMNVDEPATNGHSKRKARNSTSKPVNYNDAMSSGSDSEAPLVSIRRAFIRPPKTGHQSHLCAECHHAKSVTRPSVKRQKPLRKSPSPILTMMYPWLRRRERVESYRLRYLPRIWSRMTPLTMSL